MPRIRTRTGAATPTVPDAEDLLDRVTFHAVVRYVQRVLGVDPLPDQVTGVTREAEAAAYAAAAGMSVADIRRTILTPAVRTALVLNAATVREAHQTVHIQRSGDKFSVVTTITARRYVARRVEAQEGPDDDRRKLWRRRVVRRKRRGALPALGAP